jgi:hypothetical protein
MQIPYQVQLSLFVKKKKRKEKNEGVAFGVVGPFSLTIDGSLVISIINLE